MFRVIKELIRSQYFRLSTYSRWDGKDAGEGKRGRNLRKMGCTHGVPFICNFSSM